MIAFAVVKNKIQLSQLSDITSKQSVFIYIFTRNENVLLIMTWQFNNQEIS